MPILTVPEIQAVERYIRDHYDAVMEQDRRTRERAKARQKAPEVEEAERQDRLERLNAARRRIQQSRQERNGDPTDR
jgi:hypothetical protein